MLGLVQRPLDAALPSVREPRWSRLGRGQLLGWAAVAIVDAVILDFTVPPRRAELAIRAFHHAYDIGQAFGAGLLSAAAVEVFERWSSSRWGRRGVRGWAAIAVAAVILGVLVLPDNLGGLVRRMPGPHALWQVVITGAFALVIPLLAGTALALVERWPHPLDTWARRLVGLGGVVIAVTNHFVLQYDYGGLHLFASWAAAILLGISAAVPLPWRLSPRVRSPLLTAVASMAVCAVALAPRPQVAIELRRDMGSSIAPWILRARRPGVRVRLPHQGKWFDNRTDMSPVAPSSPPLLPADGPIVVMITIDALRANVVADPAHQALFPSITALKRESVMFTDARSAAPATSASLATLFTGKYFSQLYWTPMAGSPLICPHDNPSVRFPEILAKRGVATVTFADLPGLLNETGIVRGFGEQSYIGLPRGWAPASMVTEPLLQRLSRQGPGALFLYIHYADAHAPYDLAGTQGTDFERYLRELSVIDVELGRIRRVLAARGLDRRAAFILSADHGEAFGEHGTRHHATTVYDELLRIPLLIHTPGITPRVVDAPVSLIDVGPTILDLMGAPTPGDFMGESLTPFLRGQDPVLTRPLVAESSRGMRAMMFADGLKVIDNPRAGFHELYDLVADPRELSDLTGSRAAVSGERIDLLDSFLASHELHKPGYEAPFVR